MLPQRHQPKSPLLTLTTDFGAADGFVGAMKGVILGIAPFSRIVDISHDVPPQDIVHGGYILNEAARYFPQSTIHVAVVDPGVGSDRRPLLLNTLDHVYVAPDNGLVSFVMDRYDNLAQQPADETRDDLSDFSVVVGDVPGDCEAFVIENRELWLSEVSDTFHGRDIFAPVAAHLANGAPPESVGRKTDRVTRIRLPDATYDGEFVLGCVIHVDHFGNLISNIGLAPGESNFMGLEIAGRSIDRLSPTYADAHNELVAIVGSHGTVEVALGNGNAARTLDASVGYPIRIRFRL